MVYGFIRCVRVFTLPSLFLSQGTLKQWLGIGHYMDTVRQFTEAFGGLAKTLRGSESGGGVVPAVKVSDTAFDGIPVRVYEPPPGGEGHLRRGVMYLHGGGWALGSASESVCFCYKARYSRVS